MRSRALTLLWVCLVAFASEAQETRTSTRVRQPGTLDSSWQRFMAAGDATARQRAFEAMMALRAERNIRNLDGAALALVSLGDRNLAGGQAADAETHYGYAATLAPDLPDPAIGLARAGGSALAGTIEAVRAAASSWEGRTRLVAVAVSSVVCGLLAAVTTLGVVFLLRYGILLFHDLKENSSPNVSALAPGLFVLLVLLPLVAFQGWGWLSLWWLGLFLAYMRSSERVAAGLALVALVGVGPLVAKLEQRQWVESNPLFWASLRTLEGVGPDSDRIVLSEARGAYPGDRDLTYLLALANRRIGRESSAEDLYRSLLARAPGDPAALTNLGNVEFLRGDATSAIDRYERAAGGDAPARIRATAAYNLSIAKRFLFDYNGASELRRQADALARQATREYESLWSYPSEETVQAAVVDVAPTANELWAKFAGTRDGVGLENVTGTGRTGERPVLGAAIRVASFGLVMGLTWLALRMWRGGNLLTVRCFKCGTVFSRRSTIGAAAGGVCTQCYHLFMVKDGISGPARRQKLADVQVEEQRRGRAFRLLSILSPGAGHAFARHPVLGFVLLCIWYVAGAWVVLQLGPLPLLESPDLGRWPVIPAAAILALVFLIANVATPRLDVPMPARRPRRAA